MKLQPLALPLPKNGVQSTSDLNVNPEQGQLSSVTVRSLPSVWTTDHQGGKELFTLESTSLSKTKVMTLKARLVKSQWPTTGP